MRAVPLLVVLLAAEHPYFIIIPQGFYIRNYTSERDVSILARAVLGYLLFGGYSLSLSVSLFSSGFRQSGLEILGA